MTTITTADLGKLTSREFAGRLTYSVETRRERRDWRSMFGPYATLSEARLALQRSATEARVIDSDGQVWA